MHCDHTWYLSFFYTSIFWGLKILHSTYINLHTKIASKQYFWGSFWIFTLSQKSYTSAAPGATDKYQLWVLVICASSWCWYIQVLFVSHGLVGIGIGCVHLSSVGIGITQWYWLCACSGGKLDEVWSRQDANILVHGSLPPTNNAQKHKSTQHHWRVRKIDQWVTLGSQN